MVKSSARIFVGYKQDEMEIFKSTTIPTAQSHGHLYAGVIGPFRTMRGARFMRDHGRFNPHVQTVADAERIAKTC